MLCRRADPQGTGSPSASLEISGPQPSVAAGCAGSSTNVPPWLTACAGAADCSVTHGRHLVDLLASL
jgi:hypothetical protein